MSKLTREERLAAREADAMTTPAMEVLDLVLGQKARLLLPDKRVLMVEVQRADRGCCRLAFMRGEAASD
jgi:hypothetical protein